MMGVWFVAALMAAPSAGVLPFILYVRLA